MAKTILLIFISICLIVSLAAVVVLIQNITLNIRIRRFQKNRQNRVVNFKLVFNFILVLVFMISPVLVYRNRNTIYMNLHSFNNIHGDCIDPGDETYTPEETLDFMNYISIVTINDFEHSELFDILDEDDFPLPTITEVYSYTEITRIEGDSEVDYLYNLNYLEKEGVIVLDICDFVLELEPGTMYLIIGNYSREGNNVEGFINGAYVLKAVAIDDYDLTKPLEEQSQLLQDLIESLSKGYISNETE